MGEIKCHPPVKLIVAMFTAKPELFGVAEDRLSAGFGPIDYESAILPFNTTTYYAAEFGENLRRKIISFAELIDPGELAGIKLFTNELEMELVAGGKRRINLDPGYLSLGKLVLATTKDWQHRIYLGQRIFAEVTLRFQKGSFRPWEWTYPDYRSQEYISIFNQIRRIYREQFRWKSSDAPKPIIRQTIC